MRMNFNPATNSWIAGEGFKFEILHLERNQRGSIKVRDCLPPPPPLVGKWGMWGMRVWPMGGGGGLG